VSALFCFCAASALGDQVTLKNGDRLTGTIVKSDEKMEKLLIKTEFAGDVKVKWGAVASIATSEALHITLKNGQTIVGTVTDQVGAVVPGVTVTLVNEGTQFTRVENANASGQYVAYSFPTGRVTVSVEHPGFQKLVRSGVELTAADTITVNLQLSVGNVQLQRERFAASRGDFGNQRGKFFFVPCGDHDLGAGFGQRQRGVAANALRRAGDDCDFVFQTEHQLTPSRLDITVLLYLTLRSFSYPYRVASG